MDLFTQIKMAVSVKEAAEYYGLEVNRGNMICCPFHADRTPSMKLMRNTSTASVAGQLLT